MEKMKKAKISVKLSGNEDGGFIDIVVESEDLKESENCFYRLLSKIEKDQKKGEGTEVI